MSASCVRVEKPADHTAIKVMMVYEDTSTGLRAKRSLDYLPLEVTQATLSTRLWRCDLLRNPYLKEIAAIEASTADVILLSVHGIGELPSAVQQWLGRWLVHKGAGPCALGVLLDRESAFNTRENPVLAFVQRVADAAGADLFYGFTETTACKYISKKSSKVDKGAACGLTLPAVWRRDCN